MKKFGMSFLVILALMVFAATDAFFILDPTRQALIFQFGRPIRAETTAGLKIKLPFIQNVTYFEKRILNLDPPAQQVPLVDQRRVNVNVYSRYRIKDPLEFYKTLNDEYRAQERLSSIINSSMRRVLGTTTLTSILSSERSSIMPRIRQEVNEAAVRFGIEVVDVRLRRADLPPTNSQAVYKRMISERERERNDFLAQGQELYQGITSKADRDVVVIKAEAERKAMELRGLGEAEAMEIYAQTYKIDPEFYDFYRSLEAYKNTVGKGDTTVVLSPNSTYFKHFHNKP
jgi:membrane protease subunit HflC